MFRILTSIVLVFCFAFTALAQKGRNKAEDARTRAQAADDAQDAKTREMLQKAAQSPDAKKLPITVRNYVDASAVLIPARDASRIFGPEIGQHYAVVEVNVGNKSPDAALIIHSVFIDYTRWGMSGVVPDSGQSQQGDGQGHFDQYQTPTNSAQVASEEYRLVRGQFLNAQTWRTRSWVMRLLTLAGNVAGAYTFSLNEQGIIKGIAAFNGVVVPGINTAWPDTSQDQMNRINDLGFRANKMVPKGASEVIVCFFPIDRFLTPGFRKLFLKAPSLFFAPGLLLADKTMEKDVIRVLGDDLDMPPAALGASEGTVLQTLKGYLPCYLSILEDASPGLISKRESYYEQMKRDEIGLCLARFGLTQELDNNRPTGVLKPPPANLGTHTGFAAFMALDYLSQASLNRVHVTIDGSMTLDTSGLAAKIEGVTFDAVAGCAGPEAPCFWSPVVAGGVRTGTISGSYLTDGKVSITGSGDVKVADVTTISEGSSDQQLRFSFKLTQGASNGTLTFKVSKQPRGSDKPIDSETFVVPISGGNGSTGLPPPHPTITDVKVKDDATLSVEGSEFFDTPTYSLDINLVAPDGKEVTVEKSSVTIKDEKHLEVKIPPGADAPGCWRVTAKVNGSPLGQPPKNNTFAALPTLSTATRDGDKIIVEGEGLDAKDCRGNAPTFQLVNEGQPAITLKAKAGPTATEAAFDLTTPAAKKADTKSKVVMQFAGQKVEKQLDVKAQP